MRKVTLSMRACKQRDTNRRTHIIWRSALPSWFYCVEVRHGHLQIPVRMMHASSNMECPCNIVRSATKKYSAGAQQACAYIS